MSTGNGKNETRAVGLRFEKDRLVLELSDHREVSVPMSWYPTLQKAKPSQRKQWELIGQGSGFHWEALDLDLSVRGLVNGLPEIIPLPPRLVKRRARKSGAAA
jgi:hypothetical protein